MVLTRRANPATQELAKIAAQTSRPEVYFALLGAFARANGLVDLAQEADAALRGEPFAAPIPAVQQGRTFVRNDPRVAKEMARLLRATKKQMRQSPRQAVRSGNTIYDRNLAWFAAILAEQSDWMKLDVEELAMEGSQALTRQEPLGRPAARAAQIWALENLSRRDSLYNMATIASEPGWAYPASELRKVPALEKARELPAEFAAEAYKLLEHFEAIGLFASESDTRLAEQFNEDPEGVQAAEHAAYEWFGDTLDLRKIHAMRREPTGVRVYEWPDGWHVVWLTTTRDLQLDGKIMKNCLEHEVIHAMDDAKVYSLRDAQGRPRVNVEVANSDGVVTQFFGPQNREPSLVQTMRVMEFRGRRPILQIEVSKVPDSLLTGEQNRSWHWLGQYEAAGTVVDAFYRLLGGEPAIVLYDAFDVDKHMQFAEGLSGYNVENYAPWKWAGTGAPERLDFLDPAVTAELHWSAFRDSNKVDHVALKDDGLARMIGVWERALGIKLRPYDGQKVEFGSLAVQPRNGTAPWMDQKLVIDKEGDVVSYTTGAMFPAPGTMEVRRSQHLRPDRSGLVKPYRAPGRYV